MALVGFQRGAFQNNGFQEPGTSTGASNWDVRPVNRQRTYEHASEVIERLVDSFTKPPVEQVTEAKEALRELEALSLPELPKADFTLTYDQILEIQRIIYEQIRLMYQQEEEEFLILAAQLLL